MSEIDLQSTVTMTQGWEPNVQMQAQVLGTLQSKYDSNHKALSNLYGSLLNSPLSRSENVAAREEFFKSISGDIQKIAGMDLSLQSNVSAASKVFQSIYTNKPLVKDMVWTRNFNDQLARAESFRNCADAEKCGGQYWEEGEKYLQYKKQEFATASRDEAMNFQDPKYVPYNNFMEKAIEQANKAGLSISKDVVTGGYKVTTKNGEQLTPHLSSLFTQMFEDNPKFHDMFKVQAYNGRKDWITQQIASGTFKDEGEAMVGYVQQTADATNKRVSHLITDIDNDAAKLEERYNDLSEKYNNKTITPSEMVRLEELHKERENIGQAKSYADVLRATQKNMNNTQNIRVIADMLDDQQAALLFQDDVTKAATTLAYKDHEVTMAENKFALAQQQFGFDVQLEQIKAANAKDLVSWKAENGAYGSESTTNKMLNTLNTFQQAKAGVEKISAVERLRTELSGDSQFSEALGELNSAKDYNDAKKWIEGLPNTHAGKKTALSMLDKFQAEERAAKMKSNKAAFDARTEGNGITADDFYLYQLDENTLKAFYAEDPIFTQELIDAYDAKYPQKK